MRKIAQFLFSASMIGTMAACGTTPAPASTPTITNTPTLTATYTPRPTSTLTPTPTPAPLEYRLFWDMDESGTITKAAFRWRQARLNSPLNQLQREYMSTHPNMFHDPAQIAELEGLIAKYLAGPEHSKTPQDEFNPIMLNALDNYARLNPAVKQDDLVWLDEPMLAGFGACVDDTCVQADAEGRVLLPDKGTGTNIKLKDPYANIIAWAMRFINKTNGPVTIPAYTKDLDAAIVATMYEAPSCDADAAAQVCKQDADTVLVREQHLNDTQPRPLAEGIAAKPGDIGVIQGPLVMPIMSKDDSRLTNITYFDHDPSVGSVLLSDGSTQLCSFAGAPTCRNGAVDGHDGVDFFVPDGTLITASFPSVIVNEYLSTSIYHPRGAILDNTSITLTPGYYSEIIMYHHSASLVGLGQQLYPGEITLLSNHTGTGSPHLHFTLAGAKRTSGRKSFVIDPYGIIYDTTTDSDRYSAWTVYNMPVYPPVK